MCLKIQHFVIYATIALLWSCKENPLALSKIEGRLLEVDSTASQLNSVTKFIAPYHDRINQVLDSTLAYAPKMLTKTDGVYNTSAGNLMADIIFSEASPIVEMRTGNDIDFVLLNHGGIRSIISKGNVSARTAYEVMPFENAIAIVELTGESVQRLVEFLVNAGRAHPISGMQVQLSSSGELQSVTIQGKPLEAERTYFVATSDYLVSGGDNMVFFKEALSIGKIDYLIRNAIIDYFRKVDTVTASVDDRFIKLK